MRYVGRISGWNDDKGYGFVVPHDGGDRAFVHVKALQFGSRRPADGDLISYATERDGRGRTNAVAVRFAGQKVEVRKVSRPFPRLAVGISVLALIAAGAAFRVIPSAIAIGYGALSGLSYLLYALDKLAAEKGAQRTPENMLHFFDFLGGWPGALIAQQLARHKTVKTSFQQKFWFTVAANIGAVFWLLLSDTARPLRAPLMGQ